MSTHTSLSQLFSEIAAAIRTKKGTSATIVADNFPSEILSIEAGGFTPTGNIALTATETAQTGIDVSAYATASVAAIPSNYVGSGIARPSALMVSGNTVTAPAGYYASATSRAINNGSVTPSATKSIANHVATITPKATVGAGYVNAGTPSGTPVTVGVTELGGVIPSGNKAITSNGTGIDVSQYATVSVAIPVYDGTVV